MQLLPLLPAALGAGLAAAQTPSFAPPVRLHAGQDLLGGSRLFPSPVFHDVDGDGRLDIVVGDLPGKMTIALRLDGDGPARYGAEAKMLDAEGAVVDLHNW